MKAILTFCFLILLFIGTSCRGQSKNSPQRSELPNKTINDSIISLAKRLEGNWAFIGSTEAADSVFKLPEVDQLEIKNWVAIQSNEPVNELALKAITSEWSNNGTKLSMHIIEFDGQIRLQNERYGLLVSNDTTNEFLGISKINHEILELTNGQSYRRKK